MDGGAREVAGLTLVANAELVARVLRTSESGGSAMAAVAATRTLGLLVDDVLHALVTQARAEGHTWQEIGDVLHVTRQAAFQRFTRATEEGERMATELLAGGAQRGRDVIEQYMSGDWDALEPCLDATMTEQFTRHLFDTSREQLTLQFGDVEGFGAPLARLIDNYTVVDIPIHYQRAEMKGRVAFTSEGQIAGLFVLNPSVL